MSAATPGGKVDIRTRRREMLIDDARRVALDLFLEKGFESTSFEEISDRLGVSPRTLFRHVESKDSFLHAIQAEWSDILAAAMSPTAADERLVDAYLMAVRALCDHLELDAERSRRIVMLIYTQPTAPSSPWATHTSFKDPRMSEAIAVRLGLAVTHRNVTIFRSMLMTCVVQGLYEWAGGRGTTSLFDLLDRNLRLMRPVERAIRDDVSPT